MTTYTDDALVERELAQIHESYKAKLAAAEAERDRLREACDWMLGETRGNISIEHAHAMCMQFRTRMAALEDKP